MRARGQESRQSERQGSDAGEGNSHKDIERGRKKKPPKKIGKVKIAEKN
jgi:hypothetical protein